MKTKSIVNGDKIWKVLNGKQILNKNIEILNCYDDHLYIKGPIFPEAEKIFISACDKKFIYHWLSNSTFPNAKEIYLMSHPYDSSTLYRFPKSKLYLSENYHRYKVQHDNRFNNVILTHKKNIKIHLNELIEEPLIINLDDEQYHY